ncbi:MAG: sigma-70 family RNA polymerase sigma factor [Firmicutes bacterium]|nr:sigma-70 family RNA polymerase sigma factor [Bacillota bacterium]
MITMLSAMSSEDKSKFQKIYSNYKRLIYFTARKFLKDDYSIEDCTQRSYEIILNNIEKIRNVDSPEAKYYIYKIVRSVALHMLRDEKWYVNDVEYEDEMISTIEDEQENVEKIIINSEWKTVVEAAINDLDEDDKFLLECRLEAEMTYAHLGELLGISEDACRKRMQRIRRKLAEEVEKSR